MIKLDLLNETKSILREYNIKANKGLGQNFLIDEEVIFHTVKSADISKKDLIIEIGPGLGTLTKPLLESARESYMYRIRQKNDRHFRKKICMFR